MKILLFPFRLIAMILGGIARALGPIARFLLDFIRIAVGIVLTLTGLSVLFAILISGSVFLGLMAGSDMVNISSIPIELINESFSPIGFVAAMIVVGIPGLAIMFLGLSIASRTRIPNATVGWTMFALWLVGIIGLSFTLPAMIYDFRTEGDYTKEEYYDIGDRHMVLDINETGFEEFQQVRLKLRGYDGDQIKLVQEFSARGGTKKEAIDHAKNIKYNIAQNDSILIFDSNIDFGSETRLRGQDLMMTMYIPFGQTFSMKNDFDDLIYYSFGYQGYGSSQIIGNDWMFNPSGLECLTCTNYTSSSEKRRETYEELYEENLRTDSYDSIYDIVDFNQISISGPYKINLIRGDEYRVVLNGYDQYMELAEVSQDGNELWIKYDDEEDLDIHRYNRKIEVKIICPNIEDLRISGSTIGTVSGFEEDELYVRLTGASEIDLDADIYSLDVRLSGASQLDITGQGNGFTANLSTASFLNSYNYKAEDVSIKASGASKARVYASEKLNIEASLVSEVKYRGGAKVSKVKSSSFSNVKED